jgi:hypothetical protein
MAIGAVAGQLVSALRQPDPAAFTGLAVAVVLAGAGLLGLKRWLRRQKHGRTNGHGAGS